MTSIRNLVETIQAKATSVASRFSMRGANALRVLAVAMLGLQPALMSAATPTGMRTITLQVLDSNSGRPVSADYVQVQCREGLDQCNTFRVIADPMAAAHGELRVEVPVQATALIVNSSQEAVRQCGGSDDATTVYRVSSIESDGVVSPNECHAMAPSKLRLLSAQPGRLIVFIHHKATCKRQLPFC